ncbi:MAG: LptE family protein [Bacteroidales bacterium]|nr:LptE family protein [Bacteroidales bacterium]
MKKKLKSLKYLGAALVAVALLVGCTISYRFNGATIDYSKTKSITINYFPNRAKLVYPPLSQNFTQAVQDIFTRQTRLNVVPRDGDIEIDGEITGYDLQNMAVRADAYASEVRLTITVKVRYTDRTNPSLDLEQSFSAQRNFSSSQVLNDVQDQLASEMIEELADMIFNATVGRW